MRNGWLLYGIKTYHAMTFTCIAQVLADVDNVQYHTLGI